MRVTAATKTTRSPHLVQATDASACAPVAAAHPDSARAACSLCPRACGVRRGVGERGACGADGTARIAWADLHFWEEPPLSGSAGSGAIFFTGCPLQCVYCQNAAIARGGVGRSVDAAQLACIMRGLEARGALNINCVTATQYAPVVVEAVALARAAGLALPVVWNTSGYETVAAVRALARTVDVYLTDFKYASPALAARYSHASDYPKCTLAALDEMAAQVGSCAYDEVDGEPRLVRGVVVRHLLLPGGLEDSKRVVRMLVGRYGDTVKLSLMSQYTPVLATAAAQGDAWARRILDRCPELGNLVPPEEYEELLDYADSIGAGDYFWQEGEPAKESFIPVWDV